MLRMPHGLAAPVGGTLESDTDVSVAPSAVASVEPSAIAESLGELESDADESVTDESVTDASSSTLTSPHAPRSSNATQAHLIFIANIVPCPARIASYGVCAGSPRAVHSQRFY